MVWEHTDMPGGWQDLLREKSVQKFYVLYPLRPHPMLSVHLACIQLCSLFLKKSNYKYSTIWFVCDSKKYWTQGRHEILWTCADWSEVGRAVWVSLHLIGQKCGGGIWVPPTPHLLLGGLKWWPLINEFYTNIRKFVSNFTWMLHLNSDLLQDSLIKCLRPCKSGYKKVTFE